MTEFCNFLLMCILCFVTDFVKCKQNHAPKPFSRLLFATGGASLTRGYLYCSPMGNAVIAAFFTNFCVESQNDKGKQKSHAASLSPKGEAILILQALGLQIRESGAPLYSLTILLLAFTTPSIRMLYKYTPVL